MNYSCQDEADGFVGFAFIKGDNKMAGNYILYKDKEKKFEAKTENECLRWLQRNVPYSWNHAFLYEGWSIQKEIKTKED